MAKEACAHLKNPDFLGDCYQFVMAKKYYKLCKQAMCKAGDPNSDMKCMFTSHTALDCKMHGFKVHWKNFKDVRETCCKQYLHYVNVSVLIKFSQKTRIFTLIIISSP